MVKLLKKPPKGSKVPVVTADRIDGWAPIDEVQHHKLNGEIFNYDKVPDIARSISQNGLVEVPVLFKDSMTLESGHTRHLAFKANEYTHIPVIFSSQPIPEKLSDQIRSIRLRNDGRVRGFSDNFSGCELEITALISEQDGVIDDATISRVCQDWGVARRDWNNMKTMKNNPKWYNLYLSAKRGDIGPLDAWKKANEKKPKMRMDVELPLNLFNKQDLNFMIQSIYQSLKGVKESTFGILGHGREFRTLDKLDTVTYSTIMHGVLCSFFAAKINDFDDYADDWKATDDHNVYHDVYSPTDNTGIEVKTTLSWPPRWTPKRFKTGYHLLFASSNDLDQVFVGFGKLTEDDVKPVQQGKVEILHERLVELQSSGDFIVWKGKMKKDDKGKVKFMYDLTNFGD